LYALGDVPAHERVVARLPGRHAAGQRDAVERDVRVVVRPQRGEALLAERAEAQGRALGAVRDDAGVSHGLASSGGRAPRTAAMSSRYRASTTSQRYSACT